VTPRLCMYTTCEGAWESVSTADVHTGDGGIRGLMTVKVTVTVNTGPVEEEERVGEKMKEMEMKQNEEKEQGGGELFSTLNSKN
jgi:hypothetical protein